jgi:plasmid stabilization system protein ParE
MTSPKKRLSSAPLALTNRAITDLRGIEQYSIEQWGREIATNYLDDVAAALDRLIDNPKLLKLEPEFAPGLYFYPVRKHLLVCDWNGLSIVVLTIIHTSMDIPTRLAELQPRLAAELQFLHERLRKR